MSKIKNYIFDTFGEEAFDHIEDLGAEGYDERILR